MSITTQEKKCNDINTQDVGGKQAKHSPCQKCMFFLLLCLWHLQYGPSALFGSGHIQQLYERQIYAPLCWRVCESHIRY